MKKVLFFIIIMGLFSACSQSPEKVARAYAEAIALGDIWKAKEYVTEATGEVLDFMVKSEAINVNPDFKFNFIEASVTGDKAWVTYVDQNGTKGTIPLTKIDGKWKVDMQ